MRKKLTKEKSLAYHEKVARTYSKRGQTFITVGKEHDLSGAAVRYRVHQYIEHNKKAPLALAVKAKLAAATRNAAR